MSFELITCPSCYLQFEPQGRRPRCPSCGRRIDPQEPRQSADLPPEVAFDAGPRLQAPAYADAGRAGAEAARRLGGGDRWAAVALGGIGLVLLLAAGPDADLVLALVAVVLIASSAYTLWMSGRNSLSRTQLFLASAPRAAFQLGVWLAVFLLHAVCSG